MMKYERFVWKTEKLQNLNDEILLVVDNANEEWKGHILNIVDMLNDLNDERMMYKTTIDKRIVELEEENEQLRTLLKERQCEKDIAKCREENERLRQLYKVLNKLDVKNKRLREENEQLKKQIQI